MSVWNDAQRAAAEMIEAKQRQAPGGLEAVEKGCTCPVVDNNHGRGQPHIGDEVIYFVAEDCPVHHKSCPTRCCDVGR